MKWQHHQNRKHQQGKQKLNAIRVYLYMGLICQKFDHPIFVWIYILAILFENF